MDDAPEVHGQSGAPEAHDQTEEALEVNGQTFRLSRLRIKRPISLSHTRAVLNVVMKAASAAGDADLPEVSEPDGGQPSLLLFEQSEKRKPEESEPDGGILLLRTPAVTVHVTRHPTPQEEGRLFLCGNHAAVDAFAEQLGALHEHLRRKLLRSRTGRALLEGRAFASPLSRMPHGLRLEVGVLPGRYRAKDGGRELAQLLPPVGVHLRCVAHVALDHLWVGAGAHPGEEVWGVAYRLLAVRCHDWAPSPSQAPATQTQQAHLLLAALSARLVHQPPQQTPAQPQPQQDMTHQQQNPTEPQLPDKYARMLRVGVPKDAVRCRMRLDGVPDPERWLPEPAQPSLLLFEQSEKRKPSDRRATTSDPAPPGRPNTPQTPQPDTLQPTTKPSRRAARAARPPRPDPPTAPPPPTAHPPPTAPPPSTAHPPMAGRPPPPERPPAPPSLDQLLAARDRLRTGADSLSSRQPPRLPSRGFGLPFLADIVSKAFRLRSVEPPP
jgi:hypothetical protein